MSSASDHAMPGWVNRTTIQDLLGAGFVATRQAERNEWLDEFESDGWREVVRKPSPNNPAQKETKKAVKKAVAQSLDGGYLLRTDHKVVLPTTDGRTLRIRMVHVTSFSPGDRHGASVAFLRARKVRPWVAW
ncbi:MAG: hypothetical protein HPY71_12565 [Firmicutes bacterium]|nr:hypothetical protein [Bacillota bacterium]